MASLISEYRRFIASKGTAAGSSGFDVHGAWDGLFPHQRATLQFACEKGQQDEKHICPLQLDVIERCLTLYTNPGDLVLDPFNGIGSTGYQAIKMGRRYIGCELKPEYAKQASKFLQSAEDQNGLLLDSLEAES